jgi:phosphoglycolate phosphatase
MHDLTLVFDLDGTLVDTAPDLIAATNHVLEQVGAPPVDVDSLRPWIGYGAKYMIEMAIGPAGAKLTPEDHVQLLERYLAYYAENIAVSSRPFEGAVAALERFQAAGVKLAVCTNKMEKMSKTLLTELDLARYFTVIAGRDTFDAFKPHPNHLLETIHAAGGHAARAIMIGDTGIDIATAKAANVPVIAVTFGYTDTPVREFSPDAVIDHYRYLEPAIKELMS